MDHQSGSTVLERPETREESTPQDKPQSVVGVSRRLKMMQFGIDMILIACAYFAALWVRFHGDFGSNNIAGAYLHQIVWMLPAVVAMQVTANLMVGVYKRSWTQTGFKDLIELVLAVFMVTAALICIRMCGLLSVEGNQLSFAIIYTAAAFTTVFLLLPRLLRRLQKRQGNSIMQFVMPTDSVTQADSAAAIATTDQKQVQPDAHIIVKGASLRFRLYRNPSPGLKETVVQRVTRKNHNTVTEFDALKNINLELYPGDKLGIVGLNGAGKSTLLKMIVGIYPAAAGEIHVHGKVTPMIELGTGFDHELSGRENIYLNGALLGRSYKQMKSLESTIIEFSELGEMIDLPIKYYSSGMHARLAFSIGAICDPEILLMDEIFAAGDAQFVQKCLDRLEHMMNQCQIMVLVSHDNSHILSLCNRAIVLHKGEIVKEGTPQEAVDYYMDNIVYDAAHPAHLPVEPVPEPQQVLPEHPALCQTTNSGELAVPLG
jgi:ABC-type polysaccharide/polyol phosphate transport system ATPase subunit